MKNVVKVFRLECFVVNPEKNIAFERILAMFMLPIKAFDEDTNTYTFEATYKLWQYIKKECAYWEINVLPQDHFKRDAVRLIEMNYDE